MSTPTPLVTFEPGDSWVDVYIANPAPTGGETAATGNTIEKREGTSGAWTRIVLVGVSTFYRDYAVRSSGSYQYRVTATGPGGDSTKVTAAPDTAAALVGMWIHDPTDAAGTIRGFRHLDGDRAEKIEIESSPFQFLGRARRVFEFSDYEALDLEISALIPQSEEHAAAVQWWRDRVRARRVVLYRDNRGRLVYGVLSGLEITDTRIGTKVKTTVMTADYSEAV